MGDFPSQVNVAQAPAVEGDFASKNPRYSYDAGPNGLVAGPAGCVVGRFAWATAPLDGDGAPASVTNSGAGLPSGFVHREQQALITAYLAASGMTIAPGFGLTLMTSADFWVKNNGSTEATYGQKAYANFADGKVTFAATGTPTTSATSTASALAAGTGAATGTITDNVFTAVSALSGTFVAGANLTGTGVVSGTQIVRQLTGTAGGLGTYLLNIGEQTVASTTVSATYGVLTVGGTLTGAFAVGQALTGSSVNAQSITQLGTGTGGAGTYYTNLSQVLSSQAINASGNIETKYYARSTGLPGELVKISPTPNA